MDRSYQAIFDDLSRRIPRELLMELDRAVGDKMIETERDTLNHLVIGVYTPHTVPNVGPAISTETALPVTIDECDHRQNAESAKAFRQDVPRIADAFELMARASLERDFGNDDRAEELMNEAKTISDRAVAS